MYEAVLNGILHLFALFASAGTCERSVVDQVVARYLQRNLGLVDTDEYLALFAEFLELYEDEQDASVLEKRARGFCGSLSTRLSKQEQVVLLFRLLELVRDLQIDRSRVDALFHALTSELVVDDEELARLVKLVFSPQNVAELDDSFLVVSTDTEGAEGLRVLRAPSFSGELVVHRVGQDVLLFVVMSGELALDDNPVSCGMIHRLPPGAVIRDARGNAVYEGMIRDEFGHSESRMKPVVFEGRNIDFCFKGTDQGIHNFSFMESTGRLVGVMGGSGVGKSTLLSILNGTLRPDAGTVLLNGHDLYRDAEMLEGLIGYVPQDDLLFENLTVFENLYYSARLCMAHLPKQEIRQRVEMLLDELHQLETSDLRAGSPLDKTISGGQRKRLNIALELIREPTVLFVDEPTSGLSSSDSENVMNLLKMQAAKGKLVVVNIHQPSSVIFKMFDSLWMLDQGGYPIYTGNPLDAVRYFRDAVHLAGADRCVCSECGNVNPEQLFSIVETRKLDESGQFQRERRFSPQFWHEKHLNRHLRQGGNIEHRSEGDVERAVHRPSFFGQLGIFFKRTLLTRLANRQYLAINLLEAPVLGWLTAMVTRVARDDGYVFGDNPYLVTYFFMSIIVALFMGLSVSAEEIVRDRSILKRERFLHLSWGGYSLAKLLYLMLVSALQMALCAGVGIYVLKIPDMALKLWGVMFSCAVFGNVLGLNLSAVFKKAVSIYILIPLLLIPQMLLSGLVIRFDDMMPKNAGHHYVPLVGDVMVSRWGLEALVVEQFRSNAYQQHFVDTERQISQCEYMLLDYIPEIRSKLAFLNLESDIPNKKKDDQRYARVVRGELAKLQRLSGIEMGVKINDLLPNPSNPSRKDRDLIKKYLKTVEKHYERLQESAFSAKSDMTKALLAKFEGKEALQAFKKRNHNVNVERYARNRHDLTTIKLSGERLVQVSDPIYQPVRSEWGRAVFMSSEKRVGNVKVATFLFNLGVVWLFTAVLALFLCFRPVKS